MLRKNSDLCGTETTSFSQLEIFRRGRGEKEKRHEFSPSRYSGTHFPSEYPNRWNKRLYKYTQKMPPRSRKNSVFQNMYRTLISFWPAKSLQEIRIFRKTGILKRKFEGSRVSKKHEDIDLS
jgi:hypothetical protein